MHSYINSLSFCLGKRKNGHFGGSSRLALIKFDESSGLAIEEDPISHRLTKDSGVAARQEVVIGCFTGTLALARSTN